MDERKQTTECTAEWLTFKCRTVGLVGKILYLVCFYFVVVQVKSMHQRSIRDARCNRKLEDLEKLDNFISCSLRSHACQEEGMTIILNFPQRLVPELLACV